MKHWILTGALLAFVPVVAQAHFIWLVSGQPKPQALQVYFGEAAEPDDPQLLDKIATAEVWSIGGKEPTAIPIQKTGDALVGELPSASQKATIILRHTYGVAAKGPEPFLLMYYAKSYPTPLPGSWKPVADKQRLPLEVTPVLASDGVQCKVTWQGVAQPGATVTIVGPGIDGKLEGTTDDTGIFSCVLPKPGLYSIRAKHVETTAGKFQDKEYQSIRHYSTLTLPYQPLRVSSAMHTLPPLTKGTTSFGGAVVGSSLYVYGGNYGSSHEYANEDQSGDLWKLDLKQPKQWEIVATGPKLQGLAMVEHRGSLIRIGGFTAQNKRGEKADLRSQADVASFKPDGKWEPLASLPSPRSSHDAAVIGDKVYVVGGWNMQGGDKSAEWHDSLIALDLSAARPEWKALAKPPFQRRALALAAWQGKLYCVGGMQQDGGPTADVAVYNPANDAWSAGPRLLGTAMDGFGASAFAAGDALYASTYSGSVQRLTNDEKGWELVGQLTHPRFFHRMLPWEGKLVIVGGSDMTTGKVEKLEVINLSR